MTVADFDPAERFVAGTPRHPEVAQFVEKNQAAQNDHYGNYCCQHREPPSRASV